jgi:hypothetical protein
VAKGIVQKGRGRPAGTGRYTGGVVRFAVAPEMADWLRKFQKSGKYPSMSDAARAAIELAMKS